MPLQPSPFSPSSPHPANTCLPETPDIGSLAAWLRLAHSTGIGPVRGQQLLRHLGPPGQIFRSSASRLRALLGQERLVSALLGDDPVRDQAIEQALDWLQHRPKRFLLTLDDPRYPPALLHLADPPLLLYAEGDLDALTSPGLAIVGSRRATQDGRHNAFGFAEAMAHRGFTIVSGLAEGIDHAAHEGALAGAAGTRAVTIAALGSGIDRIYPARHRALAARIIEGHGLLISEQPLGSAPMRANFPRRNRMIAALSQGVLLVEAAMQSGSLITARLAAEIGREVMAIPGSIHNPLSRGCHHLIRQGAALIESVDDILHALGVSDGPSKRDTVGDSGPKPDRMPRPGTWPAADAEDPFSRQTNDSLSRHHTENDHGGHPGGRDTSGDKEGHGGGREVGVGVGVGAGAGAGVGVGHHDDADSQILQCLAAAPQSAEAIAGQLGWPIERTLVHIQMLELDGQIERHLDGRWQHRRFAR
ncbi:MAG: DNA-processing protein DprA [Lautropia sp.]|nr:DNA-processing protein DprA [Lautropia sp.]